jgi:hypothetical protein
VYEAACDDGQDNQIRPALMDVRNLALNVLNGQLPDGTSFSASTS